MRHKMFFLYSLYLLLAMGGGLAACSTQSTAAKVNPQFAMRFAQTTPHAGWTRVTYRERVYYLSPDKVVGADGLQDVSSGFDQTTGTPNVVLTFTPAAGKALHEATAKRVGDTLCVTLGDQVLSAALLAGAVGRRVMISGLETPAAAHDLRAGILAPPRP